MCLARVRELASTQRRSAESAVPLPPDREAYFRHRVWLCCPSLGQVQPGQPAPWPPVVSTGRRCLWGWQLEPSRWWWEKSRGRRKRRWRCWPRCWVKGSLGWGPEFPWCLQLARCGTGIWTAGGRQSKFPNIKYFTWLHFGLQNITEQDHPQRKITRATTTYHLPMISICLILVIILILLPGFIQMFIYINKHKEKSYYWHDRQVYLTSNEIFPNHAKNELYIERA